MGNALKKFILLLVVVAVGAYLYFFGIPSKPIEYIKDKMKTVELPSARQGSDEDVPESSGGKEGSGATGTGGKSKADGKKTVKVSDPLVYATETLEVRVIGYRWVKRLPKAVIGVRKGKRMIGVRVEFTLRGDREKIELPHTVLSLSYGEETRRAVGAFLSDRQRLKEMTRLDCETIRPDIIFIVPAEIKPEAMQLKADGWSLSLSKVPPLEPKREETPQPKEPVGGK